MKNRVPKSLKVLHMVLMAAFIIGILAAVIVLLINNAAAEDVLGRFKMTAGIYVYALLIMASLVCGIVYLHNDYSKKAAGFYRAFMLLTCAVSVAALVLNIVNQVFGLNLVLLVIKTVALLVLALWKDLGKRNTWIVFAVVLCVDPLIGFFYDRSQGAAPYQALVVVGRLLMDGTIGLAINGKYADKEARGTK